MNENISYPNVPEIPKENVFGNNFFLLIKLLRNLIQIFTDPEDIVIDPVAGGASSLIAAYLEGRSSYGFEIKKKFFDDAQERITECTSQGTLF